jgi:guanine deaminase
MRQAIRLSLNRIRASKGGPFGAVVVRNGRIGGRSYNQVTSTNDPTAHAEVVTIRDACLRLKTFKLDDCETYSNRERCPCAFR